MVPDVLHAPTVQVSLVSNLGSKYEEQDPPISEISLIQVGSENEPSFVFPKIHLHLFPSSSSAMVSVAQTCQEHLFETSGLQAQSMLRLSVCHKPQGPFLPCMALCAFLISVLFFTVKNGNVPF